MLHLQIKREVCTYERGNVVMNTVAIILNPNAGNKKLMNQIEEIETELKETFTNVKIYQTKQEGDGAKYVEKLASSVDLIIGAGGDGTIFELVNALAPLQERPAFAILPGGTCNDFSRTIGISQEPILAAKQIKEKKIKQIDIGTFNNQYFLNFWGIGLISKVSEQMDNNSKKLGKMSYYIQASKLIFQNEVFHLKIESDHCTYDDDAVMMVIGNGSYLGGMQSFFPQANIQDGLLDVLIIKQASMQNFWTWFQSQVKDDYPDKNNDEIVYFRTKSLKIEAQPIQKIDCDGELIAETPTSISILPQHMTIVVGDV